MEYAVEADHLYVSLQKRRILQNVTCRIKQGDIAAIIGPNGSGKSTLLRTLSRMIIPDQGSICIAGRSIDSFSRRELARNIAVLPQIRHVPDDVTVNELVRMGRFPYRRVYKALLPQDIEYIDNAIRAVRLEPYRQTPVGALSGGEQQRAWLAMLLAQRSPIWLLDEPTTYLDMPHQIHLMKLLQHINNTWGITIIVVLHDINQALHYSRRTILMKQGTIIRAGYTGEVITPESMKEIFDVDMEVVYTKNGRKVLVPADADQGGCL